MELNSEFSPRHTAMQSKLFFIGGIALIVLCYWWFTKEDYILFGNKDRMAIFGRKKPEGFAPIEQSAGGVKSGADLLPEEDGFNEFVQEYGNESNVTGEHYLPSLEMAGVPGVGHTTTKNASYDLRGDIIIPKKINMPFNNSSIDESDRVGRSLFSN